MEKKTAQLVERPPIVVIMGHIDHGKSTLLDHIRKTNIVATEAGGITQHISAYEVARKDKEGREKRITFLDTPGHAAFQGMRSRGARVADIAVLVVSAEDGVKAQTLEAYRAIKEAKIPFIVAVNKIDRPNADVARTKQTLAEAEILVEGYGGDIPWAPISAKTGEGVDALLDLILLVSEIAELTGEPEALAEGVIIESNMDAKKGATATVVITNGTIRKGLFVVAESAFAPLRIIEDFLGRPVNEASFSSPIRISGWSVVPQVGALITIYDSKKEAEAAALRAKAAAKEQSQESEEEGVVSLPIIIKADVAGVLEALLGEIGKLRLPRVKLKVIQKGIGPVSESDIKSALGAPGTIVLAFHTKVDPLATDLASRSDIAIHQFDIIYKLIEWIEAEMGRRAPHIDVVEKSGELRVLRFFSQQKDRQVIGGKVQQGCLKVGDRFKIIRREAEVGEGHVVEVQQQKIKTSEVSEGAECGLMIESKITVAERDILVPFTVVSKQ